MRIFFVVSLFADFGSVVAAAATANATALGSRRLVCGFERFDIP
jgi:hypothetical protein